MTGATQPVKRFTLNNLKVIVHQDRAALGRAAGQEAGARIRDLLKSLDRIRIVFAAAPSQKEMLDTLAAEAGIEWQRVEALHMDEYIDLPSEAPQRFGNWLMQAFFKRVPLGAIHLIKPDPARLADSLDEYAAILREQPPDMVLLGIGENGHIAFNDPPVADFKDRRLVKDVELDEVCRQQQVNDGAFPSLEEVPRRAVTLTVPALMSGKILIASVPGAAKANAVHESLTSAIGEHCPATAFRNHADISLHLDTESAAKIMNVF